MMPDDESQSTEATAGALQDVEHQGRARDLTDFANFVREKAEEIVREAERRADKTQEVQEPAESTAESSDEPQPDITSDEPQPDITSDEPQPDIISVKVNLSRPAWEALQSMSKTYGTSITDALHQAIATEYSVAQTKSRTVWSRMLLRRPA
jgi:hypothetical protein